ncbi:porin family protein [Rhizobium rhizogenes]|uniref:Porin family protein n=1 Tax=Rhizobium rhizogenes TaxID=359 RepID=A0AA88F3B5_RHIRH|nr:outer membrane protein [Rhizobium rhizogenes]KAA3500828.1 porin family protein [Rhizobium rhizogenes]
MKMLIVTSLLALSASTAMAADAVYETPAPPIAQETLPVFTWSGPYLGIQGGAGWANGDFSAGGPVGSDNFDGGILGAFAGYNYQFDNNFVVGIEGDVDYNWNDNDYAGVQIGTDWQGSVRGRVGYAFDRALLYGTAGWTATRGFIETPGAGKDSTTFNGFTVGAGLDYAFTDNVFGRLEYRYNDYGDKDIFGVNTDFDQHTVKVGLGVKF